MEYLLFDVPEDHDSHVYDWQQWRWESGAYFGGFVNYTHWVYTAKTWNNVNCGDFW